MGFAISRYWKQHPFWFEELKKEQKLLLIADYQISNEDPKTKKKKNRNRLIDKIRHRKALKKTQGASNGYEHKKHNQRD